MAYNASAMSEVFFARRIRVLQVWGEGKPDQCLLPFVGQGTVVAVASAEDHSSELGHDP